MAHKKATAPSKSRKTPRKRASSSLLSEATPSTRPKLKINPPTSQSTTLPGDEEISPPLLNHPIPKVTRLATQDLLPPHLLETQEGPPNRISASQKPKSASPISSDGFPRLSPSPEIPPPTVNLVLFSKTMFESKELETDQIPLTVDGTYDLNLAMLCRDQTGIAEHMQIYKVLRAT